MDCQSLFVIICASFIIITIIAALFSDALEDNWKQ